MSSLSSFSRPSLSLSFCVFRALSLSRARVSPTSARLLPLPPFHCLLPSSSLQTGEICLDILKGAWSPAWTLQSVCRAIIALLAHAEPDSPLNCDAGNLLRAGDVRGYNSLARMYTLECAGAAPA